MAHPGRNPAHSLAALAATLCLAAPGCHGGEPPKPAPAPAPAHTPQGAPAAGPESGGMPPATAALLAQMDKTPARVQRAIAVLRPGLQAKAQALAALKAAGAAPAQDMAPQPMLVVEVNAAQLRALLGTGQVSSVQLDTPAPSN
jgi:hypothetical protein